MKIRADRQEKIFLAHLTVVAALFFPAQGFSFLAEVAAFLLRVLTYPIELISSHENLIPHVPQHVIEVHPAVPYAIGVATASLVVVNSYLWAFVICHIKWQGRVSEGDALEQSLSNVPGSNRVG